MKNIISIAGTVGSGKSTLCRLIAKQLNYKCYVIGDIMRNIAIEHGMNIVEFDNYIKDKNEFDNLVDKRLVEISQKEDNIVFSSRTAWYFIPDSFKVYLTISDEKAAIRILNDKNRISEKKYLDEQEAILNIQKRNAMETKRYKDIYNIDVSLKENYDLYLDTSDLNINEVLNIIIEKYKQWLKGNS